MFYHYSKRAMLCVVAALFATTSIVSASSLTVSIVRTTMDQAQWDQMRGTLMEDI